MKTHKFPQSFTVCSLLTSAFGFIAPRKSPVIVLGQGNLLKVNVKTVALGGLEYPVTGQVVAVVAREARRDNPTVGGIFYHSPTGCYMRRSRGRKERKRTKSWRVKPNEKSNETNYGRGI